MDLKDVEAEIDRRLKQQKVELERTHSLLKNIICHMQQGLLFIRFDGVIQTCNPAARALLGVQNIEGDPVKSQFTDRLFGFSMEDALRVHHAPETTFVRIKEEEILVNTSVIQSVTSLSEQWNGMHDAEQGIVLLLQNITEMRRLQASADRGSRLQELGTLAAQVAHEIRNPLGGIQGFAALLQRDLAQQPKEKALVDQVVEGVNLLNGIVQKILDFARPQKMTLESTDLVAILEGIHTMLLHHPEKPEGCEITLTLPQKRIELAADPQALKRAFLNLGINAFQAMPRAGILSLELYQRGETAYLVVADTGVGIEPEKLDKLFTPLFSTKKEGNGFGLIEVQKIVHAHGGAITVASKPACGTAFTLSFPLKI